MCFIGVEMLEKKFLQNTHFNLARCSQSCLNAFDEQKKA
jgi:hypothetical protein